MSWKLILKAAGCGCNDCDSVSKAKGMSASGRTGRTRRQPMRGSSLDAQSYLACIDRLTQNYNSGRISLEEYKQGRDRCKAKFGM